MEENKMETTEETTTKNAAETLENTSPTPGVPSLGRALIRALGMGFLAGLFAGVAVAFSDAIRLWLIGGVDWTVPGFGALLYSPLLAVLGAATAAFLSLVARWVPRLGRWLAPHGLLSALLLFAFFTWLFVAFYFQRDVFGEKVGMLGPPMLKVIGVSLVLLLALVGLVRFVALRFGWPQRLATRRGQIAALLIWAVLLVALLAAWKLAPPEHLQESPSAAAPAQKLPNVLLVLSDTHRWDTVGAYTGRKDLTPHLDALAAQGVAYRNTFSTASWTKPSVASILTGRYASSHTAMLKGSLLPDEITTLPEVLAGAGYENFGIVTNYNLTPFFNFHQGFHNYIYLPPNAPFGASDVQAKLIFVEVAKKIAARLKGSRETPEDYYVPGEHVTDRALATLKERDPSRPFFMFLSYMDVHDPYFRHPYDGYAISHRGSGQLDPNDAELIAEMKSLYEGEARYWDAHFGRLVDGIREMGLFDDTMIVVVSDHGEEFGEHGGFWHGTTLYDEQIHVLHIVKYAASSALAQAAGQQTDVWHSLVDVAPQILTEVGLPIPEEMQGRAVRTDNGTPIFSEEDHQGNVLAAVRFEHEDGRVLKLIHANPGNPRGLKEVELYDMGRDPGELQNLEPTAPDEVSHGKRVLGDAMQQAAKGRATAVEGELDAEMKAQLDALGYMEDEK